MLVAWLIKNALFDAYKIFMRNYKSVSLIIVRFL